MGSKALTKITQPTKGQKQVTTSKQTNGIDVAKAASFIQRVEEREAAIDSERSKYMTAAKKIRGDIREIFGEASEIGISTRALKAAIKKRRLLAKVGEVGTDLEDDEDNQFAQLSSHYGWDDTPLAQAANNVVPLNAAADAGKAKAGIEAKPAAKAPKPAKGKGAA